MVADRRIPQLTATTSAATADEIPIWVAGSAVTRKITKANFLQGAFTGGGTLATGGFTLTVPATGTAALLATANVFTAAQKAIGAAMGAQLASSGDGQSIRHVGAIRAATMALTTGSFRTITFDGDGVLLVVEAGYAALLFATYIATTITELADPDGLVPGILTVTKSATTRNVVITNVSGTTRNVSVMALGAITAIA